MSFVVAIEGLSGAGKTTAIRSMMENLQGSGMGVEVIDVETVDSALRLRIIAERYPSAHPLRLMLFWVLRLLEDEEIINSKMDIVFVDRFWASTLALDCYGNNVPHQVINWVFAVASKPDLTIFLDASLETVRRRKLAVTTKDTVFARRVIEGYREIGRMANERNPHSWITVDAEQPSETVAEFCLRTVRDKFAQYQRAHRG